MLAAAQLIERDDAPTEDQIVVLRNLTWADYERLLDARGEHSVPKYAFWKGNLEIMSPSVYHENIKSLIGCLVEAWCLDNGVRFSPVGSWTLKNKAKESGVEPDECYVFGDPTQAQRPALAIEVIWTSGGLSKLEIYQTLGVPEVWVWRKGAIRVFALREGGYEEVDRSVHLSELDIPHLLTFLDHPTAYDAIVAYRDALRSSPA